MSDLLEWNTSKTQEITSVKGRFDLSVEVRNQIFEAEEESLQ